MENFMLNDRVELLGVMGENPPEIFGTIIGNSTVMHRGRLLTTFVVELEQGFYNPEKTMYISNVNIHADNMRKVEK